MKKALTILQWLIAGCLGVCTLANGLHWSSIFLILATVLVMPIPAIREWLSKMKIKNWLAITMAVVFMFVSILNSPIESNDTKGSGQNLGGFISSMISDNNSESSYSNSGDTNSKDDTTNSSYSQDKVEKDETEDIKQNNKISLSSIPAYSGSPYVYINDNVPNFISAELTTKGYEKYGTRDSLGRVTTAVASLGKETMPSADEERGSISSIKPTGWMQKEYDNVNGKYLYNRCHLIGWQLSAENANRDNLITGTKYFNVNGMLPFENIVADYIDETGNHVAYRVTPIFDGDNLLCNGVQIEAYSVEDRGDGIEFNVFVYNVQPDIEIDYATGNSSSETSNIVIPPPVIEEPEYTPPAQTETIMVWIPTRGGKKYHARSNCSNMIDPDYVTIEEAIYQGFDACKKCY